MSFVTSMLSNNSLNSMKGNNTPNNTQDSRPRVKFICNKPDNVDMKFIDITVNTLADCVIRDVKIFKDFAKGRITNNDLINAVNLVDYFVHLETLDKVTKNMRQIIYNKDQIIIHKNEIITQLEENADDLTKYKNLNSQLRADLVSVRKEKAILETLLEKKKDTLELALCRLGDKTDKKDDASIHKRRRIILSDDEDEYIMNLVKPVVKSNDIVIYINKNNATPVKRHRKTNANKATKEIVYTPRRIMTRNRTFMTLQQVINETFGSNRSISQYFLDENVINKFDKAHRHLYGYQVPMRNILKDDIVYFKDIILSVE